MVVETRVVLAVADYPATVSFFESFGLEIIEEFEESGPGCVMAAGRATVEILSQGHSGWVDEVETGTDQAQSFRLALQVPDTAAATARAVSAGGTVVGAPALTPWGSVNARVGAPNGLQLTLFQPADV